MCNHRRTRLGIKVFTLAPKDLQLEGPGGPFFGYFGGGWGQVLRRGAYMRVSKDQGPNIPQIRPQILGLSL